MKQMKPNAGVQWDARSESLTPRQCRSRARLTGAFSALASESSKRRLLRSQTRL